MAKITYGDKVALIQNSGIADINKVNASDMNEIKHAINDINIITASLSANSLLTIPTGQFVKIPFDVSEIIGTKLTLNNNGVQIGADVKKILINGNVRFGYSVAGTKSSRLLKNGVLVRELSMQQVTANSQSFSNLLLSVSENDVLTIEITSNNPDQNIIFSGTWLTVEFIE